MISLKMKTREKLFLLVNFERSVEKSDFFQNFLKIHLIQSNFMEQISFQLPNTLLLATTPHKKRRH